MPEDTLQVIEDVLSAVERILPDSLVEYDVSNDSIYVDCWRVLERVSLFPSGDLTSAQVAALIHDALHELDPDRYLIP